MFVKFLIPASVDIPGFYSGKPWRNPVKTHFSQAKQAHGKETLVFLASDDRHKLKYKAGVLMTVACEKWRTESHCCRIAFKITLTQKSFKTYRSYLKLRLLNIPILNSLENTACQSFQFSLPKNALNYHRPISYYQSEVQTIVHKSVIWFILGLQFNRLRNYDFFIFSFKRPKAYVVVRVFENL